MSMVFLLQLSLPGLINLNLQLLSSKLQTKRYEIYAYHILIMMCLLCDSLFLSLLLYHKFLWRCLELIAQLLGVNEIKRMTKVRISLLTIKLVFLHLSFVSNISWLDYASWEKLEFNHIVWINPYCTGLFLLHKAPISYFAKN